MPCHTCTHTTSLLLPFCLYHRCGFCTPLHTTSLTGGSCHHTPLPAPLLPAFRSNLTWFGFNTILLAFGMQPAAYQFLLTVPHYWFPLPRRTTWKGHLAHRAPRALYGQAQTWFYCTPFCYGCSYLLLVRTTAAWWNYWTGTMNVNATPRPYSLITLYTDRFFAAFCLPYLPHSACCRLYLYHTFSTFTIGIRWWNRTGTPLVPFSLCPQIMCPTCLPPDRRSLFCLLYALCHTHGTCLPVRRLEGNLIEPCGLPPHPPCLRSALFMQFFLAPHLFFGTGTFWRNYHAFLVYMRHFPGWKRICLVYYHYHSS